MEWKLAEDKKKMYDTFIKSAQDLELSIGSTEYRISKMIEARKEIDAEIKKWWDTVAVELGLEKNIDYMLNADGIIRVALKRPTTPIQVAPVGKTEPVTPEPSKVGTNAAELA